MNWEAIGAIGEIIGALAVIGSLLYLASQIKVAAKIATSQSQRETYEEFNNIVARTWASPESSDIMLRGLKDLQSLSVAERGTFHGFLGQLLNHYFMVQRMHQAGFVDEDLMETFSLNIVSLLRAPGAHTVWETWANMYPESEKLRNLIEDEAYEVPAISDLPFFNEDT